MDAPQFSVVRVCKIMQKRRYLRCSNKWGFLLVAS